MKIGVLVNDTLIKEGKVNQVIKGILNVEQMRAINEDNPENSIILFYYGLDKDKCSEIIDKEQIPYSAIRYLGQTLDISDFTLDLKGFHIQTLICNDNSLKVQLIRLKLNINVYNIEDVKTINKCSELSIENVGNSYRISKDRKEDINNKDVVNHPNHYCEGREYEPIKVINDWKLSYNLGNALKYISRLGRKDDAVQDINKSLFYLLFEAKIRGLTKEQAYNTLNQVFEK